jgi:excisionase family DNA binding protein
MAKETLLTTPQVAERLGVTVRRVQALIKAGRLPSQQFGRDHLIKESDLALVENRKPGRPSKKKTNGKK